MPSQREISESQRREETTQQHSNVNGSRGLLPSLFGSMARSMRRRSRPSRATRGRRSAEAIRQRISNLFHNGVSGVFVATATLVEETEEGEVFVAERVTCYERNWKLFACALCALLAFFIGLATLAFTGIMQIWPGGKDEMVSSEELVPTPSPTFDRTSTLEIIQERGFVWCGLPHIVEEGFFLDLVR